MDFTEELSLEERDKLVDELAHKVIEKGMETPAILFLEMHKPVSFIASQAAIVASPFLVPLFGRDGVEKYSKLFGSRDNLERVIQRIEELAEKKENSKREARNSKQAQNPECKNPKRCHR